jgi:integrase
VARQRMQRCHEMQIPVDAENTPELMAIIERQRSRRRPDCPFIFHGTSCGQPARFDKRGNRRPCLGDFQKVWDLACIAVGFTKPDPRDPKKVRAARTPHDLRRSGVKHYIDAGVDPHTVMRWSGHRTESSCGATTSSTSTISAAPASGRATTRGRRRMLSAPGNPRTTRTRPRKIKVGR